MSTIQAFKGFGKDLKCQGYQYEVGKEFEMDGQVKCCQRGFHSCENPFDVFSYYQPGENRFCEVEASGDIDKQNDGDSKIASSKLKIKAEIGIRGMVDAAIKFIFEKVKVSKETTATSGDGANSATSGHGANSATSGNGANSATSGDGANSSVGHKNAVAAAIGINSAAKGVVGSWIVVSEWVQDNEMNLVVKKVIAAQVDGKKVKADTYYTAKKGRLVEAK